MDPFPGSRVRVESGICSLRVKGIDGVRAHLEHLGTGIPPHLADQIDYHGTYLSDSRIPLGTAFIYIQARIFHLQIRTVVLALRNSLNPTRCQVPESPILDTEPKRHLKGMYFRLIVFQCEYYITYHPSPLALRRLSSDDV